jgi:hypothetical protein
MPKRGPYGSGSWSHGSILGSSGPWNPFLGECYVRTAPSGPQFSAVLGPVVYNSPRVSDR